jgi:ubiquinone/menaquinone biosynthesis C-methylase UbiE
MMPAAERNPQEDLVIETFDTKAPTYAKGYDGTSATAHSFSIRRQRVYEMVDSASGRMLDVGCGPAVTVDHFARMQFDVYGVDIAPEMIAECERLFGDLPRVHFSVGRIEKLDFPDSFFDVVTCMGVVEYLEDDDAAWREMVRVTKPGGVVIVTLPNRYSPFNVWQRTVYRSLRATGRFVLGRGRPAVEIVHKEYVEGEMRRRVPSYGLAVRDLVYYNFRALLFPLDRLLPRFGVKVSRRLEVLCRGPLGRLGTGFIVKAEKKTP